MNKKTGIILVVTNEKHNLELLYTSLAAQTYKNFSIYFVDNNSTDGSVDLSKELNKKFDFKIQYILLKENIGDHKGNSIGAAKAYEDGCDFIFVLNNDTELDPLCMEELYKLIESDEKIGVVGPIFFFWTKEKLRNKIQIYGANVNFKTQKTDIISSGEVFEDVSLPETLVCDYPIGGALFIKREVAEKLGTLFDDRWFMYSNEIDFAYNIKKLGYKSVATTKAKVWHNHKWVRDNKAGWYREYYLSERNKFLYYIKYGMYFPLLLTLAADLIKFPWRLAWFVRRCDFKLGMYYLLGMIHGLLNKKGKPKLNIIKK
ncbi:MAG TPA: glycosyltransferase family 2 protein [Ignavibacteria bacterium]|nr:glycosyltransferase family 2 protein [Ignavibacteria bacterium]